MDVKKNRNNKEKQPLPRWTRVLGVSHALGVIPALLLALSSALLFDAPGSESSPLTVLFAKCLLGLPVTLVAGAVTGITVASRPHNAFGRLMIKTIILLPFFVAILAVAVLIVIGRVCNGSLVC